MLLGSFYVNAHSNIITAAKRALELIWLNWLLLGYHTNQKYGKKIPSDLKVAKDEFFFLTLVLFLVL